MARQIDLTIHVARGFPRALWRAFKAEASARGRTATELLEDAVTAYEAESAELAAFVALADDWPGADFRGGHRPKKEEE